MSVRFVALGDDGKPKYLYKADRTTRFRQVLWGDYLDVVDESADGWLKVRWAPKSADPQDVFIRKTDTVTDRPLEIVFVDVGQGDGAVVISPQRGARERIVVVDAGEANHMANFLNARFRSYVSDFNFAAAIITHPDLDHYRGFKPIFANPRIGFGTVYHNGLVERPVPGTWDKVGGRSDPDPVTKKRYVENLALDDEVINAEFGDETVNGANQFAQVMHAALLNPRVEGFRMLSTAHGSREGGKTYVPGFAPSDGLGFTMEVLGPVVEFDGTRPRLRVLGDYGETKNGHSVLIRLTYGGYSVLFGGDLNRRAEEFLLNHYAGIEKFPKEGTQAHRDMITTASTIFRSEVMKVCHHGSADVTDAFLEAVNPAAFVVSSGDAEGHVHPRPDLLGKLGRFGRGAAPLLLITELQRSAREREEQELVDRLTKDIDRLADKPTETLIKTMKERVRALSRTNIDVWGAIYLKTDGQRLITAFKVEAGSPTKKWFYFEYVLDEAGQLKLVGQV